MKKSRSKWHTRRIKEGRAAAREADVLFGRKPKLACHEVVEIQRRASRGEKHIELSREYKVSRATVSRIYRQNLGYANFG